MAHEPIGTTETSAVGQATVLPLLQSILAAESVALPTVTNYSAWVKKGDKSVAIPRNARPTVGDKTENTSLDSQNLLFSADTITLNKHKALYSEIEDKADMQAVPDVEGRVAEEFVRAIVEQWDTDVIAELNDTSAAAPDHQIASDGYSLAEVDILEAKKLLDIQKVPQADRFMLLHPAQLKEVLQIANFVQQDRYPSSTALMNGEIGMTYGFKALMTPLATVDEALFYHRSHVGFAAQMDMAMEYDRVTRNLADGWALQSLYGVTELDGGKRGVLITVQ